MKTIFLYLLFILPTSVFAQTITEKLDAYLTAAEQAGLFSGSVLVIDKGKTVINKGYGYRDVDTKKRNNENTIYQVGSITKQFTSAVILKLEEQGRLKTEYKLSQYFPDFPNGDKITLDYLLSHRSGLFNFTSDTSISPVKPTTREKVLASVKARPLEFEPGTKYSYNNSGYIILGYIIEDLTGRRYNEVVREYILTPLQMNNTGFDFKNLQNANKAIGYNFIAGDKGIKTQVTDSSVSFSAGSMYSTVADLDKWNRSLQTEKILKQSSIKKAFTPRLSNYGLGWKMDTLAGRPVISHTGSIMGFKAYNILLPGDNCRITMLSNFSYFNEAKAAKDLVAILNNQPYEIPKTEREVTLDEAVLKQYVGEYQLSPVSSIRIRLDNGQMKAQLTGQPEFDLFAKSEKAFFLKVADVQIEFLKNAQGEVEKLLLFQGGRARPAVKVK